MKIKNKINKNEDNQTGISESKLINDIQNTLYQKESNNFLMHCRKTTEGIIMSLASLSGVDEDIAPDYMLGEVLKNNELLETIGIDHNIKSDISYIRMLGNRASHYQKYESGSTGEVNAAREAFANVIEFFFNRKGEDVPFRIKKLLNKKTYKDPGIKLYKYNLDKSLFSETLYAIETSEEDYPQKGKRVLANICYKVIIDAIGSIPRNLYKPDTNSLDIKKAIGFIAKNRYLSKDFISDLNAANDFFSTAILSQKHENKQPKASEKSNVIKIMRRISDSFFFKRFVELPDQSINAKLFFVNLFSVFMGLASVISLMYGALRQGVPFNYYSYPNLISAVMLAVSIYVISFSYELFYSALPSIRNKMIYDITSTIKEYGNIVIVIIFFLLFRFFLNDGKKDFPFLPFYITTIIWLVSLQVSTLVSGRKGIHDRFMKVVAYMMLAFIGYMIYLIIANYG